jgi:peptidyl-prolyl cis-trans isomerase SurA
MPFRSSVVLLSLCFALVGCSGGGPATGSSIAEGPPADSVVAVIDDTPLTVSELRAAYRSANTPSPPDSATSYAEFLEQYVNYRVKVRAARAAGLDSLPSLQREVHTYRQQLAEPRLLRKEVYEPLIRTLHERRQTEVDVSHILLRVDPDAPPADTQEAYLALQSIADSLERGVPFGDLAFRNSEDPSAQKQGRQGYRGHLGYLRAGQIVAPFERRMYTVVPDSVSGIFRTQFGYHLLKVHDRRPAQPPIRLSHIMLRPDSANGARRRLDSLRTAIVRDTTDFAQAARQYSQDRRSAPKGGDLGRVQSTSTLPPAFQRAVTNLDSVGAVSDVVQTRYGYHLIKLTDRESLPSYEEAYDDLKKKISGRPRVERRKAEYARQVRADAGVSVDTTRLLAETTLSSLDTLSRPLLSELDADSTAAGPTVAIATLGDSTYTLQQLARHVTQTDGGARMSVSEVLDDFLDRKALTYAQGRLEEVDPTFAAKMKEYRNGLLAFQFMQDSVWTVAARDTAALRRTFQQHRDRYRYPARVRTIVLRASADSLLTPYADETELAARIQRASADSLVTVDTMMVTDTSPAVYRRVTSVSDRTAVGPVQHRGNALLLLRDERLPPRRKRFEEALSAVIRDYQDAYEETVLARLRDRYDVTTYPERLRRAVADSSRP